MPRVMIVQSFYSFTYAIAQTALSLLYDVTPRHVRVRDGIGGWGVLRVGVLSGGGVLKQYINWIEFDWKSPFQAVSKLPIAGTCDPFFGVVFWSHL